MGGIFRSLGQVQSQCAPLSQPPQPAWSQVTIELLHRARSRSLWSFSIISFTSFTDVTLFRAMPGAFLRAESRARRSVRSPTTPGRRKFKFALFRCRELQGQTLLRWRSKGNSSGRPVHFSAWNPANTVRASALLTWLVILI